MRKSRGKLRRQQRIKADRNQQQVQMVIQHGLIAGRLAATAATMLPRRGGKTSCSNENKDKERHFFCQDKTREDIASSPASTSLSGGWDGFGSGVGSDSSGDSRTRGGNSCTSYEQEGEGDIVSDYDDSRERHGPPSPSSTHGSGDWDGFPGTSTFSRSGGGSLEVGTWEHGGHWEPEVATPTGGGSHLSGKAGHEALPLELHAAFSGFGASTQSLGLKAMLGICGSTVSALHAVDTEPERKPVFGATCASQALKCLLGVTPRPTPTTTLFGSNSKSRALKRLVGVALPSMIVDVGGGNVARTVANLEMGGYIVPADVAGPIVGRTVTCLKLITCLELEARVGVEIVPVDGGKPIAGHTVARLEVEGASGSDLVRADCPREGEGERRGLQSEIPVPAPATRGGGGGGAVVCGPPPGFEQLLLTLSSQSQQVAVVGDAPLADPPLPARMPMLSQSNPQPLRLPPGFGRSPLLLPPPGFGLSTADALLAPAAIAGHVSSSTLWMSTALLPPSSGGGGGQMSRRSSSAAFTIDDGRFGFIRNLAEMDMGKVELGPRLGKGGCAEVYRLHMIDADHQRDVDAYTGGAGLVVKIVPQGCDYVKNIVMEKELDIVSRFPSGCHLNIMDIVSTSYEHLCMVMPAAVCDLQSMLDDKVVLSAMSPAERMRMAAGGARGLHYLHSKLGLTQGDTKPENLLVSPDLVIKVSDFGFTGGSNKESLVGVTKRYAAPETTASFQRPEIIQKPLLQPAQDIFSFAIVVTQMLFIEGDSRFSEKALISRGMSPRNQSFDTALDNFMWLLGRAEATGKFEDQQRLEAAHNVVLNLHEDYAAQLAKMGDLRTTILDRERWMKQGDLELHFQEEVTLLLLSMLHKNPLRRASLDIVAELLECPLLWSPVEAAAVAQDFDGGNGLWGGIGHGYYASPVLPAYAREIIEGTIRDGLLGNPALDTASGLWWEAPQYQKPWWEHPPPIKSIVP